METTTLISSFGSSQFFSNLKCHNNTTYANQPR
jgi:hypothetical protein